MLRHLSIRSKLLALLLLSGVLCIAVTGLIADRSGTKSLRQSIFGQLTTLRESKKAEVERYFGQLERQFVALSKSPDTVSAADAFTRGFDEQDIANVSPTDLQAFYKDKFIPHITGLGVDETPKSYMPTSALSLRLQTDYIAHNPYPPDEKYKLVSAGNGSAYDKAHAFYHPFLARMADASNLSDISVVDPNTGYVVYTVYKGAEFGANLKEGPLAQTGIARAFEAAIHSGSVVFEDFSPYAPSYFAPAAFIATPVMEDGRMKAVLIAEVMKDDLEAVMSADRRWEDAGLGKTGEVYLAGADRTMRSGSRFHDENPDQYYKDLAENGVAATDIARIKRFGSVILNQPTISSAVDLALKGESGTDILTDYRGAEVLDSWSPIDVLGSRWAIVAKMDTSEALAPIGNFRQRLLQVGAAATALLTLFSLLAAGIFTHPIREVLNGVNRLAAGKEDTRIDVSGHDEFSELGQAFNSMADEIAARTEKIEHKTLEYETLLRNVYPDIVAERIKLGDETAAEVVKNVSIIVLSIEGVNALITNSAEDTVRRMNELIGDFDQAASEAGIEKLCTVGETYLAACGLSSPRLDGPNRALEFVRKAALIVDRHAQSWSLPLSIRGGVAIGDAEVGLIGRQRTVYEVWGVTMLTARRMVFDAAPGEVHVTKAVLDQLPDPEGFAKGQSFNIHNAGTVVTWKRPILQQTETGVAAQ
ncbi:adenylate/guanylate cyclase domain-containing protein [Mesorhizobium sp. VK25A]|uniref:adenylate cyclase n=1 Tax=Mesorhizobium vachelliae TaxID=3072309 RepID=A0ABU5AE82_9HYPH|nr:MULTISPECIES: adenylate/guanylate cyclase domain-containing protein [unclassified Mesorhizobium]MDX8535589.1 adenylate/guanylate cyclase domain-containing protein [Mesorhizobium sp. VK25D]MDX8548291.1 adenylate/guanylate cyclase domain-containing protein [Mesorhizobium sp. VK25A]